MNHLRKQNRSDQNGNTMNKTTTVICEINLDANSHRDGVYHSGQKLNGNVILTLHGKQKIKSVVVQILGIGKCAWTEQRRAFGAEEIYIKDEIKIYESSGDYMSPGIYIYPFETELPSNLPTSCEGKYGFIRYLASANVIRPNATTQTQTIAFTVIKPHNLNALSIVQCPTQKQQTIKFFQLLSMKLNNITITATIPTSGYAPGQMISIDMGVNNRSNCDITSFRIVLNKVVDYYDTTRKHSKQHKLSLAVVTFDGCRANTCTNHMPQVAIPPAPATDTTSSKILHITYELKIYGNFAGNTMRSLIKLPITIGTVPLYSTYRCVHFEDSTEYNHIEPFTYEALVDDYMQLGESESNKEYKYAPVYPIFKMRPIKQRRNSQRLSESSSMSSAD